MNQMLFRIQKGEYRTMGKKKKMTAEEAQAYEDYKERIKLEGSSFTLVCKVCGCDLQIDLSRQGSSTCIYWCRGCGTLITTKDSGKYGRYYVEKPDTLKNIDLK